MSDKRKILKHGNHSINDKFKGYMYNLNISGGYDFNSHVHNCYEFIHVIEGQLLYTVEGTEYALSAGDMIMTSPEELHSFSFPTECEYRREFLHIYPGFIKDYPELTAALSERSPGEHNRLPAEYVEKYGLDKLFDAIEDCCREPDSYTDLLVLTYAIQLIVKICRMLRTEVFKTDEVPKDTKTNAVCRYIDSHYNENISVERIANELFVSPSHLSRKFRAETGMTIKAYLNMRRITHAKNLIMEGQRIIKSIYPTCGYSDYSTFFRAFVKYTGMSPEEFKQTHSSLTAI